MIQAGMDLNVLDPDLLGLFNSKLIIGVRYHRHWLFHNMNIWQNHNVHRLCIIKMSTYDGE